jgi:hypothetical protein
VTSIALAFGAAFLFGLALVLTQLGLRDVPALAGAGISIPSSTLLFVCVAPIAQEQLVWACALPRCALPRTGANARIVADC